MIKLKTLLEYTRNKKEKLSEYMFYDEANKILPGQNKAPHGVIILNGNQSYSVVNKKQQANKILVGMNHGAPLLLSRDLYILIVNVGNRYGYFYEGRTKEIHLSKLKYKGGYDENANEQLTAKDIPEEVRPYGTYVFFVDESKGNTLGDLLAVLNKKEVELKIQKEKDNTVKLPSEMTIFDVMLNVEFSPGLKIYDQVYLYKNVAKTYSPDEKNRYLNKYLTLIGVRNLAEALCTPENFSTFWKAGKQAIFGNEETSKKFTDPIGTVREQLVLNKYKGGVFFWGSGHLHSYQRTNKFKMIGGETIGNDIKTT